MVIEKAVDLIKKLPGVSYVLAVVTYLGALAVGAKELTGWPLLAVCGVCAAAYAIGSAIDTPVYDRLYGPHHVRPWLPLSRQLAASRDRLVRKIFGERGVSGYAEAHAERLIGVDGKPSLYTLAKSAAEGGKEWEGRILYAHDISKAARSFLVVSAALMLAALIEAAAPKLLPEATSLGLARMGFFAHPVLHVAVLPLMLWAYLSLRAYHQVALYDVVADKGHIVPLPTGERMVLIPRAQFK